MQRFPNHARVAFIGDSITAAGLWIAHIYDHYLKHFPDADIRMYNTGISGGSAGSALLYFEENIMVYRPTHAVIMLGMNDVDRNGYDVDADGAHVDKNPVRWMNALDRYEKGMRELTEKLISRGVKLTFVTPTCYDESTLPRLLDKVGCDAALEYAGELNRRLAAETGSDFVNFHAPIRLMNTAKNIIRDDRVHPIEPGHVLMARLFLAAQGLTDEPTPVNMDSMPAPDDLLPVNQARFEAERIIRMFWNNEWLILRGQPKDAETRKAFMNAYTSDAPYFVGLRDAYLQNIDRIDELKQEELAAVEACAAGK